MVVGIGLDFIDIGQWEVSVGEKGVPPIDRVFTPAERDYCQRQVDPFAYAAGLFAAKRAALKAFARTSQTDSDLEEIEVLHDRGECVLSLNGTLLELKAQMGVTRCFLSMSHTKFHAVAVVVLEA